MKQWLLGAIGTGSWIVGTFFARYWRRTHDRLYLFFAASFLIQAIDRLLLGLYGGASEDDAFFYVIRLAAYLLIVVAIIDKNRGLAPR